VSGWLKYQSLQCATVHRALWLMVAAIPFALPVPSGVAVSAMSVLLAASWFMNFLAAPAWVACCPRSDWAVLKSGLELSPRNLGFTLHWQTDMLDIQQIGVKAKKHCFASLFFQGFIMGGPRPSGKHFELRGHGAGTKRRSLLLTSLQ